MRLKKNVWNHALIASLLIGSAPALAELPGLELIRTDAPVMTATGEYVGGRITSDPIYDEDGDLIKGELEVTFALNASSANSYRVNGIPVTPGGSETFVFDFDATSGKLDIPVSVEGAGSVSVDDYDLSIRVPGLVLWRLSKANYQDPMQFLPAFYGPDGLIWLPVRWTKTGEEALGIIKVDVQGNVIDSLSLNAGIGSWYSYEGDTPEGNVILSSDQHSVIVAPDGEVVADYPLRIFEALPDGTIYREAGESNNWYQRRLGRLLPNGDHEITEHPANVWHSTRMEGSWGVSYSGWNGSATINHVDLDGVVTRYDATGKDGADADYSIAYHGGSITNGWLKLYRSFFFINKDGRAKYLNTTDGDVPELGFTITSKGEWILTNSARWNYLPSELIKVSPDGTSAKTAEIFCSGATSTDLFGKGSVRDSKLIMNCGASVMLVNLEAESKFTPWTKFIALEDVAPGSVTQGAKNANFTGASGTLSSSGLMHRTDFTYPTQIIKP